jgi:AraC-like DNA-binding protein
MEYVIYSPSVPLKEFVTCFWMITDGDTGRRERILPNGSSELVINLCENEIRTYDPTQPERVNRLSGAVFAGTYSRALICDARQHRSMLGVHFRPGGALCFMGTPATELSDAHANLEDLWGSRARALREQICEATTARERFELMEQALLDRARRVPRRHPAVEAALRLFGPFGTDSSTREVAQELGISQRRFIDLFAHQVGLTPKLLCRILRFKYARILAEKLESQSREAPAIDWAQIAIACGYYDQSHLIRDFENLSGLSPSQYIRQLQPARDRKDNHVSPPRITLGQIPEFLAARDLTDHNVPLIR